MADSEHRAFRDRLVATLRAIAEAVRRGRALPPETRHAVRAGATMLSLLGPVPGMPDPRPQRERIADLLARLDAIEGAP